MRSKDALGAASGGLLAALSTVLLSTVLSSYGHDYAVTISTNSYGEFVYEVGVLVAVIAFGVALFADRTRAVSV